jgi:hypothetical protein
LGVQKAPLLLKFDHKFAWEGLTLIERKTASSNRIAVINLNLLRDLLRSRAVLFALGAIRPSESDDNVENFRKNGVHKFSRNGTKPSG